MKDFTSDTVYKYNCFILIFYSYKSTRHYYHIATTVRSETAIRDMRVPFCRSEGFGQKCDGYRFTSRLIFEKIWRNYHSNNHPQLKSSLVCKSEAFHDCHYNDSLLKASNLVCEGIQNRLVCKLQLQEDIQLDHLKFERSKYDTKEQLSYEDSLPSPAHAILTSPCGQVLALTSKSVSAINSR